MNHKGKLTHLLYFLCISGPHECLLNFHTKTLINSLCYRTTNILTPARVHDSCGVIWLSPTSFSTLTSTQNFCHCIFLWPLKVCKFANLVPPPDSRENGSSTCLVLSEDLSRNRVFEFGGE